MAVFTPEQVAEVVRQVNAGEVTVEQLSQQYGMDANLIQENMDAINSGQEAPNAPNQETHQVTQPVDTQAFVDAISGAGTVATVSNIGNNVDGTSVAGQNAIIAAAAGNPAPTNNPLPNVTVTENTPGTVPAVGPTQAPLPQASSQQQQATAPIQNRGITGVNNPISSTVIPEDAAERLALIKRGLDYTAGGNVSLAGADLQAVPTDLSGTVTNSSVVEQIEPITPVVAQDANAAQAQAQVAAGTTSTDPLEVQASLIDAVSQVPVASSTTAATGAVDPLAVATRDDSGLSGTNTSTAAQITDIPPEAQVEAVVGQMTGDQIVEAAKVAGIETARITRAKTQLRNAGLSESDISQLANDPDSLELRLTDFTEEQRGIIGGLPEEALVSVQMEQLLAGIENGDVPPWAKPAVDSVEQMLASRGMNSSTVGRDSLVNAIIQNSIPIAQANAQAIQQSVLQQRGFEQQAALTDAQFKQQAVLQNAQNAFNLNLTNMSNEQQAELANAQFMQTVTVTNTNNKQQTAIQNAINMTQMDMELIDHNTRLAVQNAQSFMQMDLSNLNNEQQAVVIDAQFEQQRLLSNASAENAAKQFNASSENQTNQFMSQLKANIDQFNVQQSNAMSTFNATESNRIAAQNSNNQTQISQYNSQLRAQVDQFNGQQDLAREQWNAANAQAIEQSNVQWRRQANTANTASQNAINQQNVQNAFSLTAQAQAAIWQELRDQATFTFQAYENKEDREAQLYATAIGNESAASNSFDQTTHLVNLAASFFAE